MRAYTHTRAHAHARTRTRARTRTHSHARTRARTHALTHARCWVRPGEPRWPPSQAKCTLAEEVEQYAHADDEHEQEGGDPSEHGSTE
eukprot:10033464-Alexandrium_andersonii.AAC.1